MRSILTKTDQHILLDNLPVYIYEGDSNYLSPSSVDIAETDCGYLLTISSILPVTLVIPCGQRRIIVGDNFDFVDTRSVVQYYCSGPTKILAHDNMEQIYSSMIHLIGEDSLSISVFGESVISLFTHAYEQYTSITGIPDQSKIVFYIDISSDYKINLQRQVPQKRSLSYVDCLDENDLALSVYYGINLIPVESNIEQFIDLVYSIQQIFEKEKLYSMITGSVAEGLNGIPCFIRDCDFMFKNRPSMVHAAELLAEHGWNISKNLERNISLIKEQHKIDLSYDNYNLINFPMYVRESHGLRFLDAQGLMWIALLNQQEFDRTPYKNGYPRNNRMLFELTLHASRTKTTCNDKIGQQLLKLVNLTEECKKISGHLYDTPLMFKETRINFPFRINCFGYDYERVFSIVNTGTISDARVVTDIKPTHAIWVDINKEKQEATIEQHETFSLLFLKNIKHPGILYCIDSSKELKLIKLKEYIGVLF